MFSYKDFRENTCSAVIGTEASYTGVEDECGMELEATRVESFGPGGMPGIQSGYRESTKKGVFFVFR